jgi:hypothetical protein
MQRLRLTGLLWRRDTIAYSFLEATAICASIQSPDFLSIQECVGSMVDGPSL